MSSGTVSQEEVARTGLRGGLRQKEPVGEIRSWVRLKSWPVGPNQPGKHSVGKVRGVATRKRDTRIKRGTGSTPREALDGQQSQPGAQCHLQSVRSPAA